MDAEVARPRSRSLYGQVVGINGAVFVAGTAVLAFSPASVSRDVLVSESVVLAVGLSVMVALNALLLRASLAPVDRVVRQMGVVDLDALEGADGEVRPLDEVHGGPGAALVRSYNAMVERLADERRTRSARTVEAQEAERQRVARELHDEVGQSLTVVLLGLKQIADRAPADLREELDLVRESARAGLDDVRRVARRLRPGVLDDLGLQAALAALVSDVGERVARSGTRVRRTFGPGLPAVGTDAELAVYRVAQEALTNAVRHAQAEVVTLSLTRVGEVLRLEVADDGRGATSTLGGSGVPGMRDRARLVDGRLVLRTAPGEGTHVVLEVPARG